MYTEQTAKASDEFERYRRCCSLSLNKFCFEPYCLFLAMALWKQLMYGLRSFLWMVAIVALKQRWRLVGWAICSCQSFVIPQQWQQQEAIGMGLLLRERCQLPVQHSKDRISILREKTNWTCFLSLCCWPSMTVLSKHDYAKFKALFFTFFYLSPSVTNLAFELLILNMRARIL